MSQENVELIQRGITAWNREGMGDQLVVAPMALVLSMRRSRPGFKAGVTPFA